MASMFTRFVEAVRAKIWPRDQPYGALEDDLESQVPLNTEVTGSNWVSQWNTIKEFAPYFWPENEFMLRVRVVGCVALIVLSKGLGAFVPLLYAGAVDAVTNGRLGLHFFILYGVLRFVSSAINDVRDSLFIDVSQHATEIISTKTYAHLHNLSVGWHTKRRTGGVLRTIDRATSSATTLLSLIIFKLLPTLLEVLMVCVILWIAFDFVYSVITFVTIASYVVFTFSITEWRSKFRRGMNDTNNAVNDRAMDGLVNFETVKCFTAEEHEVGRYRSALQDYFVTQKKTKWSLTVLNGGQSLIISAGLTLAMILSGRKVANGDFEIGDLIAINSYIIQLYTPLNWLGTAYSMINTAFIDMEKMFDLLSETSDVHDADDAGSLKVKGGHVKFEDVSFQYQENKGLLEHVSFEILPGTMTAIVGSSGAGKSTISRLLLRYYDVTGGRITIDGHDIREITMHSLREAIGVVPQDTVLFNDGVGYNIQYGRRDASDYEVEQAAIDAQIHDFIMDSPEEYDTIVGERGIRLSGGEKQRVAIARTLLKNPPLLILDEATSALDTTTEKQIQAALTEVARGRTTLVIAHRLSTVVNCEQIIVLDQGKIVEKGTYETLTSDPNSVFLRMWQQQAETDSTSEEAGSSDDNEEEEEKAVSGDSVV
eukprot:TRINITY_DN7331_c0_g1_i1.p1 TRINITY_DN7331_c0_g1~~TRINITY_DN7331_c0_g1_i1.p1  ORF type:complete len:653 (-),score=145.02 TRINITY_DN7331_c0_g1_i1:30-1988(-)